jgi:hypothetical protein
MKIILSSLMALGLIAGALAAQGEPANELYQELVKVGIAIPDGPTVPLPVPLCTPGQVPADPAAVLEKAAGRVPTELFIKRTDFAPMNLTISQVAKANGDRCGQKIDLWFVTYGKLDAVLESDVIKQLFAGKGKAKGGESNEPTVLKTAELTARGIRLLAPQPKMKEQYETIAMTLLDKVQVQGVTRNLRTTAANSILFTTKLDDRFKADKEYPNRWQAIQRNADDEERLGPAHPYTGLGGYALVTALPEPRGAMLIELHYLFHEPPGWFGERDLLRAKLPTVIQENVRSFRRKLK